MSEEDKDKDHTRAGGRKSMGWWVWKRGPKEKELQGIRFQGAMVSFQTES